MTELNPVWLAEQDDRAAADLSAERRELTLDALYHAAMLGLPEDALRHLCAETGVTYRDVETYTPPILRTKERSEPTLDLQF